LWVAVGGGTRECNCGSRIDETHCDVGLGVGRVGIEEEVVVCSTSASIRSELCVVLLEVGLISQSISGVDSI